MYKYCIKHLKFTENQTQSRLASARLLTDLPEIEGKVESGELNITTMSKIQSFVRAEKSAACTLDKNEKLELIAQLENKSTRQVDNELIARSHQPALMAEKFQRTSSFLIQQNQDDTLSPQYSKFEALLNFEQQDLLQEFRNLYAYELRDNSNVSTLLFLLKKAR